MDSGILWVKSGRCVFSKLFTDIVVNAPLGEEDYVNFIPGLFSWSQTILLGKSVGATPNGRNAGTPINHGANPFPQFY